MTKRDAVLIFRLMSNNRNKDSTRFAAMFKALSNPRRLEIFRRLASCCAPGTRCCGEDKITECVGQLGKDLGVVPSTVSHHIKELHRAGLISMERRGQRIECWVEPKTLEELKSFFQ